jgi:hypothetical protein
MRRTTSITVPQNNRHSTSNESFLQEPTMKSSREGINVHKSYVWTELRNELESSLSLRSHLASTKSRNTLDRSSRTFGSTSASVMPPQSQHTKKPPSKTRKLCHDFCLHSQNTSDEDDFSKSAQFQEDHLIDVMKEASAVVHDTRRQPGAGSWLTSGSANAA